MTDREILTQAIECGIVNIRTLEQGIAMRIRQKYLEQHEYKVWQGKDGKWYTYVPCKDKRRLIKKNTKSALEDAIVDFYEQMDDGNPTFARAFYLWIENKMKYNEICKGTYDRYVQEYDRFIKGTDFDYTKVKSITENDIEDFLKDCIREHELTRKRFSGLRTVFLGTFKYAKRQGWTKISISSFFDDLLISSRTFRHVRKDADEQVYREDDIPVLMDCLKQSDNIIDLGIALDFLTGMRSGELVALKYSDLQDDRIHVQRQQIRYKDGEHSYKYEIVDYTKTECGDRWVYITQDAINLIRRIHRQNPFCDYLFDGIKKSQFNKYLVKACKRCGVKYRSMHKIRKTYGTTLIDNGVEDSLIMAQMGHKDIKTTRDYYYFENKCNDHKREQIIRSVNF